MGNIIKKPENVFLVLCLLFSGIFMFINPPFQTPDEAQHFFKMWGFTNRTLNFKVLNKYAGDVLPESVIEISRFDRLCRNPQLKTTKKEILSALKIKLEKDKTKFFAFTPTGYSPIAYSPSFLILWVMKLVNVPPLIMLYVLRLCSLFLYTGLMYQAIKTIPTKKWLFAILGLTPVTLYEASSVTIDALTMGSSFLFIAYTLKLTLDENIQKICKKEFWIFGLLLMLVLLCKYAYLPLILLYFCIPKEKFVSQKSRFLYFLGLLTLCVIYIAVYILGLLSLSQGVIAGQPGYDKKFMIGFILHRFSWFVDFFIKTVQDQWSVYLYSYIGLLGCNHTFVPILVVDSFLGVLVAASLFKTEKKEPVFTLKMKAVFLAVFLSAFAIILTSSFILFQCYPVICGVQGRYFIPIMPLLFCLLDNKKLSWEKLPIFLIISVVLLMPMVVNTLISRFYF